MGLGKYGELIPIKKPTDFDVTTENTNTAMDKTNMPRPETNSDNVSTENNTVTTENDVTVSTENTSKGVIPSTGSEKNILKTVNTGNDSMSNVPNANMQTEDTGTRVSSRNRQP